MLRVPKRGWMPPSRNSSPSSAPSAGGRAPEAVGSGSVRDMVQAHAKHSHRGADPADTGVRPRRALVPAARRVEGVRYITGRGGATWQAGRQRHRRQGRPRRSPGTAEAIRNVALVGPAGSGKTTLVETLLVSAGVLNRAGSTARARTVCDFDEAEHAPAAVRRAGARAAGARRGQGQPARHPRLRRLRRRAAGRACGPPTARCSWSPPTRASTSRPGRCGASAPRSACRGSWWSPSSTTPAPTTTAWCAQAQAGVRGQGAAGLPARGGPAGRADHRATPRRATTSSAAALIEGVIEESEDETLMERYLGGEEVDAALLVGDLERAVARGSFHPVVPVDSSTGVGARELLDLVVAGFPSPLEHPMPEVFTPAGQARARPDLRPRRPAGGRGREDHQRPVRRPGQPGAGVLRHRAARRDRARLRPLRAVLRRRDGGTAPARGPRRGRADRRAVGRRSARCSGPRARWSPATSARSAG